MPDLHPHHCDVLVVGAGPAGQAAAVSAAAHGCRVLLTDDNAAPGGQIWRGQNRKPVDTLAAEWLPKLHASSTKQMYGMRVIAGSRPGVLLAESSEGCHALHYNKLILATGARERFLPFPGWTLPNVLGAGGLQALVKSGLPLTGKRVAVAGSGPLLLAVAAAFRKYGATVVTICEQASWKQLVGFGLALARSPKKIVQAMQYKKSLGRVPYRMGWWPVKAHGTTCVEQVTFSNGRSQYTVDCDYLACGFHLVPNTELAALLGCRVVKGLVTVDAWQQTSAANILCAGEPTGIGGVELAIVEGQIAGLAAAGERSRAKVLFRQRRQLGKFSDCLNVSFALRSELRHLAQQDTIVCRCEDVSYGQLTTQTCWRQAKLHTRCGMGPCQGRICGAATEFLFDWGVDSVRPPIAPVRYQTLLHATANNETERQES